MWHQMWESYVHVRWVNNEESMWEKKSCAALNANVHKQLQEHRWKEIASRKGFYALNRLRTMIYWWVTGFRVQPTTYCFNGFSKQRRKTADKCVHCLCPRTKSRILVSTINRSRKFNTASKTNQFPWNWSSSFSFIFTILRRFKFGLFHRFQT